MYAQLVLTDLCYKNCRGCILHTTRDVSRARILSWTGLKHVIEKFAVLGVKEVIVYTTAVFHWLSHYIQVVAELCRELSMKAYLVAPPSILESRHVLNIIMRCRDSVALLVLAGGPSPELHTKLYPEFSDYYIGFPEFADMYSALKMSGAEVGVYMLVTRELLREENLFRLRTLVETLQLDLVYLDRSRTDSHLPRDDLTKITKVLGRRARLDCSLTSTCPAREGKILCVWPDGDVTICVKTRDAVCKALGSTAHEIQQLVQEAASRTNPCSK